MDINCDMLQKSQTYMTPWYGWFVGPAVALLQCPSLKALVAEVVAAQPGVFNGLVDPEGIGEGLGIKQDEEILRRHALSPICSEVWDVPVSFVRCGGGRAFTPSSPKLFLLRSRILTVWLIRKASARACGVGQVEKTGSSAYQDFHSRPLISDPHLTIQPTLFYMFDHILQTRS